MNASQSVHQIAEAPRRRGEPALCAYAKRFDKMRLRPGELRVSPDELRKARQRVSPQFLKTIAECAKQVRRFAENEKRRLPASWMIFPGGARVGQVGRPVDNAGLYIP